MTLFQEHRPERARTYRSVADAFRGADYACAVQRFPRYTLLRRVWHFLFGEPR